MGDRWPFVMALVAALGGAGLLLWAGRGRRSADTADTAAPIPAASPASSPRAASSAGSSAAGSSAAGSSAAGSSAAGSSAAAAPAASGSAAPANAQPAGCPAGMVLVSGTYCPFVAHRCEEQVAPPTRGQRLPPAERRCRRYQDELICEGRPVLLHFCIDRFEYPNLAGAKPAVMVDYRQAAGACAAEGKRLCDVEEWTFACEGRATLPYSHGLEREPGRCNIDRRRRIANEAALASPPSRSTEVERLDQRTAAGVLDGCMSPFGAFDMTGNVAEWVRYREGRRGRIPSDTVLAGGHWDRVAATCRLLDVEHAASFRDHRTGFRCCAESLERVPARRLADPGARLPRRRAIVGTGAERRGRETR